MVILLASLRSRSRHARPYRSCECGHSAGGVLLRINECLKVFQVLCGNALHGETTLCFDEACCSDLVQVLRVLREKADPCGDTLGIAGTRDVSSGFVIHRFRHWAEIRDEHRLSE